MRISKKQAAILELLTRLGYTKPDGILQSRLCELLTCSKSALSQTLGVMEKNGLIGKIKKKNPDTGKPGNFIYANSSSTPKVKSEPSSDSELPMDEPLKVKGKGSKTISPAPKPKATKANKKSNPKNPEKKEHEDPGPQNDFQTAIVEALQTVENAITTKSKWKGGAGKMQEALRKISKTIGFNDTPKAEKKAIQEEIQEAKISPLEVESEESTEETEKSLEAADHYLEQTHSHSILLDKFTLRAESLVYNPTTHRHILKTLKQIKFQHVTNGSEHHWKKRFPNYKVKFSFRKRTNRMLFRFNFKPEKKFDRHKINTHAIIFLEKTLGLNIKRWKLVGRSGENELTVDWLNLSPDFVKNIQESIVKNNDLWIKSQWIRHNPTGQNVKVYYKENGIRIEGTLNGEAERAIEAIPLGKLKFQKTEYINELVNLEQNELLRKIDKNVNLATKGIFYSHILAEQKRARDGNGSELTLYHAY